MDYPRGVTRDYVFILASPLLSRDAFASRLLGWNNGRPSTWIGGRRQTKAQQEAKEKDAGQEIVTAIMGN